MAGAFKNLWNSEKAIAVGVLVVCATVLVATGWMPVAEWSEYTKYLATVYVAGKTIQGGTEAIARRSNPESEIVKVLGDLVGSKPTPPLEPERAPS